MAWLKGIIGGRSIVNLAFAVAAVGLFALENWRRDIALHNTQFFNGWTLAVCMAVMLLFASRKRVIILPFGRARFWLLVHYYVGFFTVAVFLVHTRYRIPDSPLEWLMWVLFVLVAISGIAGAILAKVIPPRLEAAGERILFDRIPVFRAELAERAETLARDSVADGSTQSIARLYADVLGKFFARPRNIASHLAASKVPLVRVLGELSAIERYLDTPGKARLAMLRELVEAKNNLDFQYANGGLLRLWLFLHIPPTYALIVVVVVHVLLIYAFSAG